MIKFTNKEAAMLIKEACGRLELYVKDQRANRIMTEIKDLCAYFGEELSTRECEILKHVVDGHSLKFIGNELFITEKTVKFHLTTIYRKLGVKNKSQLIAEYYKNEISKLRASAGIGQSTPQGISAREERGLPPVDLPSGFGGERTLSEANQ